MWRSKPWLISADSPEWTCGNTSNVTLETLAHVESQWAEPLGIVLQSIGLQTLEFVGSRSEEPLGLRAGVISEHCIRLRNPNLPITEFDPQVDDAF